MNEFTAEAMELRILAKATLLVDHDDEAFRRLSKAYMEICGHPPFSGFDITTMTVLWKKLRFNADGYLQRGNSENLHQEIQISYKNQKRRSKP